MKTSYDRHYLNQHLFGDPHDLLIRYFQANSNQSTLLDIGCGQGRNSLALAALGYRVEAIDISKVGLKQIEETGTRHNLDIVLHLGNIYSWTDFSGYQYIVFDSFFHFTKKTSIEERRLTEVMAKTATPGTRIIIAMPNIRQKTSALFKVVEETKRWSTSIVKPFTYIYKDPESSHESRSAYLFIVLDEIA